MNRSYRDHHRQLQYIQQNQVFLRLSPEKTWHFSVVRSLNQIPEISMGISIATAIATAANLIFLIIKPSEKQEKQIT
jgi:hypothetical protein